MRTQRRILLLFALSSALFLIGVTSTYFFSRARQLHFKKSEIENRQYSVDISWMKSAEYLYKFAVDYSLWDELTKFANGENPGWAEDNINTLLKTSMIRYVWVYDKNCKLTYSMFDSDHLKIDNPAPLSSFSTLFDIKENPKKHFCHFYINSGDSLIEISGAAIHSSKDYDRKSRPQGFFFIGRVVDKESLDELEAITNSTVKLSFDNAADFETDKYRTVISKYIQDWEGKRIARVDFISEDKFTKTEDEYYMYSLSVYLIFVIAVLIIAFVVIKKNITRPLLLITESLDNQSEKPIHTLLDNPDEFGKIAHLIKNSFIQKQELEKHSNLIEEQNQQLEELNATKDKFFSIIAHDLKNPFGVILATTEFMTNPNYHLSMEEYIDFSKDINQTARVLFNLLENLLTWARSQRGQIPYQPDMVNVNELINNNCMMLQQQAESKKIHLKTDLEDNLIAYIDENMITTVIRNLMTNAIKFTNEKGEITVKSRDYNDKFIQISVRDNGVGIAEDVIKKLFRIDVNVTTAGTSQEKGTGLGLILCKEFVEKNGGKIWVESEIGKGSKFKFTIPKNKN